jgi:hypothetical protein
VDAKTGGDGLDSGNDVGQQVVAETDTLESEGKPKKKKSKKKVT